MTSVQGNKERHHLTDVFEAVFQATGVHQQANVRVKVSKGRAVLMYQI